MELLLEVELPFKLINNNDGQGKSWFRSSNQRKKAERLLRYRKLTRKPFRFPVRLVVTRILGPREKLWDYSNIGRGNWKQLEDALVKCGWFHDDSPKWITHVDFEQDDSQRSNGPAVKIQVYST